MRFRNYELTEKLELIGDLVEDALQEEHGLGIEIGVWLGKTSGYLLNRFPNLQMVGIDPYSTYHKSGNNEQEVLSEEDGIRHKLWFADSWVANKYHNQVVQKMSAQFGDRFRLIRQTSSESTEEFRDGTLDFVYIDGNHFFKYVWDDIQNYWPKVRHGGWLIGDDFTWMHLNVAHAVIDRFGPRFSMMADTWFVKKN